MDIAQFKEWLQNLPSDEESSCGYFTDLTAKMKAFKVSDVVSSDVQEYLITAGFRRSGDLFYANVCDHCKKCQSIRINLSQFKLSRSLKRVLSKNSQVVVQVVEPKIDTIKEFLYLRYQKMRHHDESQEFSTLHYLQSMRHQMYQNPQGTLELQLILDNKLIGFGIIDCGMVTVSPVYSVFEVELAKQSLGSLFILKVIEWAKENDYRYINLGYYIEGHKKMHYKNKFKPYELSHPSSNIWCE